MQRDPRTLNLDNLDLPDASLDALWAKEANDRLAAYRRGEVKAVALPDVIAQLRKPYHCRSRLM